MVILLWMMLRTTGVMRRILRNCRLYKPLYIDLLNVYSLGAEDAEAQGYY